MKTITEFSFALNWEYIKHIKEKSYYNHNYYELTVEPYGDYILPAKCNILYEECEDDCAGAYYSLGYFDETDKFVSCWTWFEDDVV